MSLSNLFQLALVLAVITASISNKCTKLRKNVDLILSIGPWEANMAVITTDLHTFKLAQLADSASLTLAGPFPLSNKYASLHSELKKGGVKSSDNLIQVSGTDKALYSGSGGSWSIPLTGEGSKSKVSVDSSIKSAVWASNDNGSEVVAFNGKSVTTCSFSGTSVSAGGGTKSVCQAGDNVKIGNCATSVSWPIKKAFRFAGNYYLLTADTVYIFKATAGGSDTPLTTVKYENFIQCSDSGGDDDGRNDDDDNGGIGGGHISKTIIIVVVIIGLLLLLLIIVIVFCVCRRKKHTKGHSGNGGGANGGNNGTNSSNSKRNKKKESHQHKKSSKNNHGSSAHPAHSSRHHHHNNNNNTSGAGTASKRHRRSHHPNTVKRSGSSSTMKAKTGTNKPPKQQRSTSQNSGRTTPTDHIQKVYKVTPMSSSQIPSHWSTTRKKRNK
ncbi:hypothetical protein TYRP_001141 [Tyrophagus putrescentiae]|nr:hypothetical protein TYRP_001141 [Tyrophagus putrescentiae]